MKLNPEVYRKAAQRIEQGHNYGSCCAIACIEQEEFGPYNRAYDKVFRPCDQTHEDFWVSHFTTPETSQPIRATMLYLMAELVETNSLP